MDNSKRIMALWNHLLENVNYETMIPKFTGYAVACIRELAEIAEEDENYEENWREAMEQADDDERPEVTFFCALSAAALTEGEERERLILGYASNLDAQLKTQRRCRICGCTDENAC